MSFRYSNVLSKPCLCSIHPCVHVTVSVVNEKKNIVDNSLLDDYFKIIMIVDESGSMSDIKDKMIMAINDLIKEQKQVKERPATFTLVKFNDQVNRVIKNRDLNTVELLSSSDYVPSGPTALYDAIGDTVDWFKNEKDVLLVIVTDGQDNVSRKFNKKTVMNLINQKKELNNWSYVYLSDDITTYKEGNNMGLQTSSYSSNVCMSKANISDYIRNDVNNAVSKYRKSGITVQSQLNSQQ